LELGDHALQGPEVLPRLVPITQPGGLEHLPPEPECLAYEGGAGLCADVPPEGIKP
jgi:hypothetical protein